MATKTSKREKVLPVEELPEFFREFADEMEAALRGREEGRSNLGLFRRMKIKIKNAGPQAVVKFKMERDTPGETVGAESRPRRTKSKKGSYKELKKRMDKTFSSLSRSLREGVIPSGTDIERFYREVQQMVTYKDKGKPHYAEFVKVSNGFFGACRDGDLSAAQTAYQRLRDLKKVCHDRFK